MKITLISITTTQDQGIRTLSSILKKENYEVNLVFMGYQEGYYTPYRKEILEQLKNICKNSELIGINCFISTKFRAVQVIRYLRKELKATIVFGGIHVTIAPTECIKDHSILCLGEAEEAIVDIANAIKKKKPLDKIKNLWIRKENEIIKNPVRDLVGNLDKLPYPDYDLKNHYILDGNRIRKFQERDIGREILFLSGRGCPYACDYCSNSTFNELYKCSKKKIPRHHSVNYIIGFLKQIKSKFKNVDYVGLRDDTFTMRDIGQIKEFCKKYKKEINMNFFISADARTISEDKVKLLVDAGCVDVNLGIQGSERVNKEVYHRYIDNDSILKAAIIFNKYKDKVCVHYDLISTSPYDTEQDILDVIAFVKKLPKPFALGLNNLTFFVGSKLYNRAVRDGTIKSFKDTANTLEHGDRSGHILLKKKNIYLNTILNLMRGSVIENKYGDLSERQLDLLINKTLIKIFNDGNPLVYIFPYSLKFFDFMKYNIAMRIYSKIPFSIKEWLVKRKYSGKIHYSDINIRQGEK